jgi:hypothetical protein
MFLLLVQTPGKYGMYILVKADNIGYYAVFGLQLQLHSK